MADPRSRMGSTIAKQWLAPASDDAETYPGHEIRLMLAREYLELEAENERLRELNEGAFGEIHLLREYIEAFGPDELATYDALRAANSEEGR
jgi:hypothetical protein